MKITPVSKAVMQSRRRTSNMPRKTEEQQLQDSSYRMGYHVGYHTLPYNNPYSSYDEAQMHIKYKTGFVEGKMMHQKENKE